MEYSKLSSYHFSKGKFIAPWNEFMKPVDDEMSWTYGRLPEYLWIALILQQYGRVEGFKRLNPILHTIESQTSLRHIRMSDFLSAREEDKQIIFQTLVSEVGIDCISPLTVLITGEVDSLFAHSFSNRSPVEDRIGVIQDCLQSTMNQHSHDSTDIRYVVLVYAQLTGELRFMREQAEAIYRYQFLDHSDADMQVIRPMIRSCELMVLVKEKANEQYLARFWEVISELTECDLYMIEHNREERQTSDYLAKAKSIFEYLQKMLVACNPLDRRMKVLLSIATYSYRRFEEADQHGLYNSISGRSIIRCMIENYIMMKYMVTLEKEKPSIWADFESYGIGQYKLVLVRHRETESTRESHVDTGILEAIVNEFHYEEFQDMDTSYFDKLSVREKANKVGEKDLFGLYYDYDSAYEHGLWGAIRECALLKCDNPAHQYHCIPNVCEEISLKSVFDDCVFVLNRTMEIIDSQFGIPEKLMKEVRSYEQSVTITED